MVPPPPLNVYLSSNFGRGRLGALIPPMLRNKLFSVPPPEPLSKAPPASVAYSNWTANCEYLMIPWLINVFGRHGREKHAVLAYFSRFLNKTFHLPAVKTGAALPYFPTARPQKRTMLEALKSERHFFQQSGFSNSSPNFHCKQWEKFLGPLRLTSNVCETGPGTIIAVRLSRMALDFAKCSCYYAIDLGIWLNRIRRFPGIVLIACMMNYVS